MSKFTLGPWRYDGRNYIVNSDCNMVGEVRGWGWLQYKGEEAATAEQDANGMMMAAALEAQQIGPMPCGSRRAA